MTKLPHTPSASEKSSFHGREPGEAVNFVISDRSALDADWNLSVAFLLHSMRLPFTDEHKQPPYISSARLALKYLFTAVKSLVFQMLSKEVERLLSCDSDVKNGIWKSLSCSLRENRFFYWLSRCRWLSQRPKSRFLLSQKLGSGCLGSH